MNNPQKPRNIYNPETTELHLKIIELKIKEIEKQEYPIIPEDVKDSLQVLKDTLDDLFREIYPHR